jgi:hypothetical protein
MLQPIVALDQLLNTLVGGWADETISARAWRCQSYSRKWRMVRVVVDALFFWQDNHCRSAYFSEQERFHMPIHYREL